jgi:hypothetical protein
MYGGSAERRKRRFALARAQWRFEDRNSGIGGRPYSTYRDGKLYMRRPVKRQDYELLKDAGVIVAILAFVWLMLVAG